MSDTPARLGRQPSTTQAELSHIALQLFIENGFEATTIDQIAARAGIGRRTVFRYFPSKNDLPWGDFESLLTRMREFLNATPAEVPLVEALRVAVVEFNRFPPEEVPYHRQRMELLLNVPTLVAHSTLRYQAWRGVVAEFAAMRLGVDVGSLQPQAMAWAYLAASMSAYEQWLRHDDAQLVDLIDEAIATLGTAFDPNLRTS